MKTDIFDYQLDPALIAQHPAQVRSASRMLVVSRQTGEWRDSRFTELPEMLQPGEVLVLNNSRVIPARLLGRKIPGGGKCELLLAEQLEDRVWNCLANPSRSLRVGTRMEFSGGTIEGIITACLPNGVRAVRFECQGDFRTLLESAGRMPLPPYIKRGVLEEEEDRERYQTVFARHEGSIAAPTAGLHFTREILRRLSQRGVEIVEITHHVGLATFQPVKAGEVELHQLARENFEISQAAARALNRARSDCRRIIAAGTTATRALESAIDSHGEITSGSRQTSLFIYPGYQFRVISGLLTNFHLPRSTLLMLVCALLTRERTLAAYNHAVSARYRFYSYGDCMLAL